MEVKSTELGVHSGNKQICEGDHRSSTVSGFHWRLWKIQSSLTPRWEFMMLCMKGQTCHLSAVSGDRAKTIMTTRSLGKRTMRTHHHSKPGPKVQNTAHPREKELGISKSGVSAFMAHISALHIIQNPPSRPPPSKEINKNHPSNPLFRIEN